MPNPKNIRSFSSTPALEKGLAQVKKNSGLSISEIIRRAIRAFIKRYQ
jgi:hypothetical protein